MGFEQKGLPSPRHQPFVYQADGIIIFVFWSRKYLPHGYADICISDLVFNL